MSLRHLIKDATEYASNLKNIIDDIAQAVPDSFGSDEELRIENSRLKAEVTRLRTEKKAIQQAFETLSALREKDKQVIKIWQERLNEVEKPEIRSEEATQDVGTNPQMPSSPPLLRPTDQESEERIHSGSEEGESQIPVHLSQRALPLSIGVVELAESDIHHPNANTQNSDTSASQAQHNQVQNHDQNKQSHLKQESSSSINTDQLIGKEWHPEDFVINSAYEGPNKDYDLMDKQNTPAGFWEVDFPSSSQISRQKAAAKDQIRLEGQKRLREALTGGRYAFKDNKLRRSLRKRS